MFAGQRLTDSLVLDRVLGSGAMGTVWLARSTTLGGPVAVKVITSATRHRPVRRSRSVREDLQ